MFTFSHTLFYYSIVNNLIYTMHDGRNSHVRLSWPTMKEHFYFAPEESEDLNQILTQARYRLIRTQQ
jgi:hypothetical protein